VRLDDHTPAHRALSQVAAARTGSRFGPDWRRRPGCPRHSWIQQIDDGTPFSIRAEWSKARRRGHSGLTQRTSAVYAIYDDDKHRIRRRSRRKSPSDAWSLILLSVKEHKFLGMSTWQQVLQNCTRVQVQVPSICI